MDWELLTVNQVIAMHDMVLGKSELAGLAKDKSLGGALARVEFRAHYGLIEDVYDLAAMYAVAIAQAHAFNDANKRTAFVAMKTVLSGHNTNLVLETKIAGDMIIKAAQGVLDEADLAAWLRSPN